MDAATADGRAATPIEREGARVAALVHDPALGDEPELLEAVTAAAGIAIENARLQAELRARLEELQGSRARVIEAGQKERQRLERNLHDGAQQRLIALSLELGLLGARAARSRDAGAARAGAARDRGSPSRSCATSPAASTRRCVSGHGLAVALESLAARAPVPVRPRRASSPSGCPSRSRSRPTTSSPRAWPTSASTRRRRRRTRRRRPAPATCSWSRSSTTASGGADTERGSGLRGLADRVEALGGRAAGLEPAGRRHARAGGDPMRVVIAEDSVLLREGLARLLAEAGFEVVGHLRRRRRAAAAGAQLRAGRRDRRHPAAAHAHRRGPARGARDPRRAPVDVGVLVLSQYVELGLALKLLSDSAEGVGYLLKDRISDVDDFVAAVRRVAAGGSALDPIIVSTLCSRQRRRTTRSPS